eukprot:Platyproteum_vivax@DN5919_c0_g1_i3.p1
MMAPEVPCAATRSVSLPSSCSRPQKLHTKEPQYYGDVVDSLMGDTKMAAGVKRSIKAASEIVEQNQAQIPFWVVCGILVLLAYHVCSDGDYSFMLTVGSIVSLLSFILMISKIVKSNDMSGISIEMMKCYALLSAARLTSILVYDSYLPFDKSGDYVYRVGEILNTVASIGIVAAAMYMPRLKQTVSQEDDVVKLVYLAVPSVVVAILLHPSLNGFILTDIAWAFALYLECVAVMPQLFMFNRQKKVDITTTHFLAAQALSRLLSFTFWFWTWHELNEVNHIFTLKKYVGQWTLFMQAAQLVVLGDFIFNYVRAIVTGSSLANMLIPSPGV